MQTITKKESHSDHGHDHSQCEMPEPEMRGGAATHNHHEHELHAGHTDSPSNFRMAVAATLHCLLGCGIGEIVGIIVGTLFALDMWTTMVLGLLLGLVFGMALGVIPLLRGGFDWRAAFRVVMISEGLSISGDGNCRSGCSDLHSRRDDGWSG